MTDEELDHARAEEARRRLFPNDHMWTYPALASLAARLTREGWMPPDPLAEERNKLISSHVPVLATGQLWVQVLIDAAMDRGIEIGEARQPKEGEAIVEKVSLPTTQRSGDKRKNTAEVTFCWFNKNAPAEIKALCDRVGK